MMRLAMPRFTQAAATAVLFMAALLAPSLTLAQLAPPPPPRFNRPPPPPASYIAAQEAVAQRQARIDQSRDPFIEAYRKAGQPRILVLCGVDARWLAVNMGPQLRIENQRVVRIGLGYPWPRYVELMNRTQITNELAPKIRQWTQGRDAVAVGRVDNQGHIGQYLALWDPHNIADVLQTRIEAELQDNTDVQLMDVRALAERDRREGDAPQTKINADLVLVVHMRPVPQSKQATLGGPYRITVEALQPASGRKLTSFGFTWVRGLHAHDVAAYGQDIAMKFREQFIKLNFEQPRRYTLRIIGMPVQQMAGFAQQMSATPNMLEVVQRDANSQESRLELRYNGPVFGLANAAKAAAERASGRQVTIRDIAEGTLTLMVNSAPAPAAAPTAAAPPAVPAPAVYRYEVTVEGVATLAQAGALSRGFQSIQGVDRVTDRSFAGGSYKLELIYQVSQRPLVTELVQQCQRIAGGLASVAASSNRQITLTLRPGPATPTATPEP